MILVCGHTKGGVGKSIIALNIAIERQRQGRNVLLIDGDPRQLSVSRSADVRNSQEKLPQLSCAMVENIRDLNLIIGDNKNKDCDIIIDIGGKDSSLLRASLLACDIFLLPVGPESVEIWAIDDISQIIMEAKLLHSFRAFALLNRSKATSKDNIDTLEILAEYKEFIILPMCIGSRAAFSSAFGKGQSITEFRPKNKKGIEEILALVQYVFGE